MAVCLGYTAWAYVRNAYCRWRDRKLPMNGPLVSVVVPVGRRDRAHEIMMRSLRAQTYRDVEIIAIDDTAHRGAGWARNRGLHCARGKYVLFLDADDFFEPMLVSRLVHLAESRQLDLAICRSDRYEQNWHLFSPMSGVFRRKLVPGKSVFSAADCGANVLQAVGIDIWVKLFRRDFVLESGIRFQEIPRSNDVYFSLALSARAERIAVDETVLVHYRHGQKTNLQSGNNQSPTSFFMALDALENMMKVKGAPAGFAESYGKMKEQVIRHNLAKTTGFARLEIVRRLRTPRVRFLVGGPRIGGGSEYVRRKISLWRCEVTDRNPDLVHINHLRCLLKWALNLFRDRAVTTVFVVHGIHLRKYDFLPRTAANRIKRELRLCLEKWLYAKVDELVALNADDVKMLRETYRVRTPIRLEPNAVESVTPDAREPEFAFLTVARFDFQKGYDILLAAIAEAQNDLRAAKKRTLLIGGGETLEAMKAFAAEKGIADLVEFAGEISNAADEMGRGRILVAPSRWEGSPYAVLEAVARGKKVIASDCPGNKDIIREDENGWLFPAGDAKALVELLVQK